MRFSEDRVHSTRLAAQTMARLAELAIPPNPENFMVWYTYFSGKDPDFSHMIDRLIDVGDEFSPECCNSLYARCVAFNGTDAENDRDAALMNVSGEI